MSGGRLTNTPIEQNLALEVDDVEMSAFGKIQGQIDAAGVAVYATYAAANTAMLAGSLTPNQMVRITADETNGGFGACYVANVDSSGVVWDFDFTTQTYLAQQLTLLWVDQESPIVERIRRMMLVT